MTDDLKGSVWRKPNNRSPGSWTRFEVGSVDATYVYGFYVRADGTSKERGSQIRRDPKTGGPRGYERLP